MNLNSINLKLIIGAFYLLILFTVLYFLFSFVDVKDLMSYEFIRLNKDTIIQYKNNNYLFLSISFFIFSIIWVLLLGFAAPILLFAGFVFGPGGWIIDRFVSSDNQKSSRFTSWIVTIIMSIGVIAFALIWISGN